MSLQPVGDINSKVFEFEWKINNSDLTSKANGQRVSSSTIVTHSFGKEIKWRVDLYPKGCNKECENSVSIFLTNLSCFEVYIDSHFFLLNNVNMKVKQWYMKKKLFSQSSSKWGSLHFLEQCFIIDPNSNIIKDGKITLGFEIVIDSVLNLDHKSFVRIKEFDDLEKLFLNEKFSDLTVISADKKKLKVYKGILASRSPVFEAMFEHNMAETNQGIVNIEDIEYEVLYEVFRFMYTAKVNNIEAMLPKLLYAAEKYSVEGLKALCEETMLNRLANSNAIKYLIVADQNNCSNAKRTITEFIVKRAEDFINTPGFISLGKSHFNLLHKIINGLVSKNKNK